MGLFSFLKSDKPVYSDWVWKSKPMAWRGMITETLKTITQNETPIVFCFFEETQTEIEAFLSDSKVPYYKLAPDLMGEGAQQNKVVFLADANHTSLSSLIDLIKKFNTRNKVSFFFAEHYPLPAKENLVVQKLNTTFPQCSITFCSSLDDPCFEAFGSKNIIGMMEKMGMKEDEVIEHAMVSSAMKRAREKLAECITKEIPAHSETEWLRLNVKKKV
jgi:hypothetical protein